jgi:ABC-type multidrug transport system fused ATPase/permease subunit
MAASPMLPRSRWTPTPSPTTPLNGVGGIGKHGIGRGVFLTWHDVSVTAVDEKGKHKLILDRINGCARPGQVLALMGASGSGKSTLLDTLSGNINGHILISAFYFVPNGFTQFVRIDIRSFRNTALRI